MSNRYEIIRSHYEYLTPKIFEAAKERVRGWVSPLAPIDWNIMFTPIERFTWQAIRYFGMAPFYPQYPVAGYFLDFGNPVVKVAIECDGYEFHQDKEKDRKRDIALFENGWRVYRISGSDCVRPIMPEYYEIDSYYYPDEKAQILAQYYNKTVEGLINALAIYYFDYQFYYREADEYGLAVQCLENRISLKNKISHGNTYCYLKQLV